MLLKLLLLIAALDYLPCSGSVDVGRSLSYNNNCFSQSWGLSLKVHDVVTTLCIHVVYMDRFVKVQSLSQLMQIQELTALLLVFEKTSLLNR